MQENNPIKPSPPASDTWEDGHMHFCSDNLNVAAESSELRFSNRLLSDFGESETMSTINFPVLC